MKNFIFYLTCAISICASVSYFFSEKEENTELRKKLVEAQDEIVTNRIVAAIQKVDSYNQGFSEGYSIAQESLSPQNEEGDIVILNPAQPRDLDYGEPALPSNGDGQPHVSAKHGVTAVTKMPSPVGLPSVDYYHYLVEYERQQEQKRRRSYRGERTR